MQKKSLALAGLTIFVGSFLLFLIQPMIGNLLLPHFGGTATVWMICLCSFQVLLILGYAYAHWIGGARHKSIHVWLLLLSAAGLIPLSRLSMDLANGLSATSPILAILAFFALSVAFPYVLVGANAGLIQSLVARDRGAYRLYAVSNAGSFAGLLGYPFVVELTLTTGEQLRFFSLALAVYAVMLAVLLAAMRNEPVRKRDSLFLAFRDEGAGRWFLLSATSCFLLDAVSAHLCMEVTPLPLMWCAILAIYLLTWIIAFTDRGAKASGWVAAILVLAVGAAVWHLHEGQTKEYFTELAVSLTLLFFGTWFVHARLYASRPEVNRLTGYYFIIAIGGAVGGVAASLVAPLVFSFIAEYPVALAAVAACVFEYLAELLRRRGVDVRRRHVAIAATVVGAVAFYQSRPGFGNLVYKCRSFYGTTKIVSYFKGYDSVGGVNEYITMQNNGTTHGMQIANGDWRGYQPTSYFTELGGGMCFVQHPLRKAGKPIRAAVLGMGIGTLACHGNDGDLIRFFEINPDVVRLANDPRHFTFLSKSSAKIEVVTDDARKALEREEAAGEPKYDLLVVDVFSGDSIPPHLATREAIALYLGRLKEDGILAFHVTNWHLDLFPIMKAIGREFSLETLGVANEAVNNAYVSFWTYFSRKPAGFALDEKWQFVIDYGPVKDITLMTDEFHPMVPHLAVRAADRLVLHRPKEK